MAVKVEFEPIGRRGEFPESTSLLECAQALGIALRALCGGRGDCGRCLVQVIAGHITPPTTVERRLLTPEQLQQGYRLACRTRVLSPCTVYVPPDSLSITQRLQIEGERIPVEPAPLVRLLPTSVPPPSLKDLRADAERVLDALRSTHGLEASLDLEVLRDLPERLRAGNWDARLVLRKGEIIAVLSQEDVPLGLAVDIGTTKVAAYLIDLAEARTLAARGFMNPQIAYGEDVISRITYAMEKAERAQKLQEMVVEAINQALREMCAQIGARPSQVVEAVMVGNTAMHHLLLRLPVKQLGYAPYVPAVQSALEVKARELGLAMAPGAVVYLPPLVAGYVGSDHIAALIAGGFAEIEGPALLLDIGTNTEICLAHEGRLISLSCASGPAFEGAHITCGMRAAPGAIESFRLTDAGVEFQTVGDAPPVGLCGSGILDVVAQLRLAGVLDARGLMGQHPRVREVNGQRAFVITEAEGEHPAVTFTQKDVREIQLAKGAIRTGIEILLRETGVAPQELREVILAGAFGTYINVESAVAIGMLPRLPLERFRQIGNAAGTGARAMLISASTRALAERLARRVEYIELAAVPDFQEVFAEAVTLD